MQKKITMISNQDQTTLNLNRMQLSGTKDNKPYTTSAQTNMSMGRLKKGQEEFNTSKLSGQDNDNDDDNDNEDDIPRGARK